VNWRTPYLSLIVAAITVGLYLVAPLTGLPSNSPFGLLVLDKTQPMDLWRGLTAHWLHTDANHLLWNTSAILLLACLVEQRSRTLLVVALVVGMVAVSGWFAYQSLSTYYCGWSGVLNCLLLVALAGLYWGPQDASKARYRHVNNGILGVIAVGALLKSLYEYATGTALVSNTLWPSSPGAHLAGLFAGTLLIASQLLWWKLAIRNRKSTPQVR